MDRDNPFVKLYEHITHRRVKLFTNYAMAPCPFHEDKQPSMAFYRDHVHCFGCGYHTSSVSRFARDLLGLPYGADETPLWQLAQTLKIDLHQKHSPRPQTPPGGWLFAAAGVPVGVVYHYPTLPRKLGKYQTWPPAPRGDVGAYSLWVINSVGRPPVYLLGKFSNPKQQLDIPVYLPKQFEDLRFYMYRLVYLPYAVLLHNEEIPLHIAIQRALDEEVDWYLFNARQLATLAAYMLKYGKHAASMLNAMALTRQAIGIRPHNP